MSGNNDTIKNKLIFTSEGRRLLVSQESGIKFAILGAVLIQGLDPVEPDDMFDTYKDITLQDLCNGTVKINTGDSEKTISGIVMGIKNTEYVSRDNSKIIPQDRTKYNETLANLTKADLLDVVYGVSGEIKDLKSSIYGTYDLPIDRTSISLSWTSSEHEMVTFSHIGLIGKIFAETDDAVFNVDNTQRPVLVALAQVCGKDPNTEEYLPGIQILQDQNVYTGIMLQLHMTVADHDFDFEASPGFDKEDEQTQEILNISRKLDLVNNGLLTKPEEGVKMQLAIGSDEEVIEGLNLNENGNIATPKTLMVADALSVADMSEQWNAAGMIHAINKKDTENRYKPQVVLTTIDQPTIDNSVDIPIYSVELKMQGHDEEVSAAITGNYLNPDNWEDPETRQNHRMSDYDVPFSGTPDPLFNLGANPEQDDTAVSIFGLDNYFLNDVSEEPEFRNRDKAIFSKNNVTMDPAAIEEYNGYNVFFNSENNLLKEVGANTNNTFIKADHNLLREGAHDNIFIGADSNNLIDHPYKNAIINSWYNVISGASAFYNTIIGGHDNGIYSARNVMCIGSEGAYATEVGKKQYIFGYYNKNVPSAAVIYGNGNSLRDRRNALEFYPDDGTLILYNKEGDKTVAIGGEDGIDIDSISLTSVSADNLYADSLSANDGTFEKLYVKQYVCVDDNSHFSGALLPDKLVLSVNEGLVGWYTGMVDPAANDPMYYVKASNIKLNGLQFVHEIADNSYNLIVGANTSTTNNVRLCNNYGSVYKYNSTDYIGSYFSECEADLYVTGTALSGTGAFTVTVGDIRVSNPGAKRSFELYINDLIGYGLIGFTDSTGEINGDSMYYAEKLSTRRVTGSSAELVMGPEFAFLDNAYKMPFYKKELPNMCSRIKLNIYITGIISCNPIITWLPFRYKDNMAKYGNVECIMNVYMPVLEVAGTSTAVTKNIYCWRNKKPVFVGQGYNPTTINDYISFNDRINDNNQFNVYTGLFRQFIGKATTDWTDTTKLTSDFNFAPGFYASYTVAP